MAQQTINIGTFSNDGTGDPARVAFAKCNANFSDLYVNGTAGIDNTARAAAAAAQTTANTANATANSALTAAQSTLKTNISLVQTNPPISAPVAQGNQLIYSLATLTPGSSYTKYTANYVAVNDNGAVNSFVGGYGRVWQCDLNLSGASLLGSRATANFTVNVNGATGNTSANPSTYGCLNSYATGNVTDGGTGLTTTLASPNLSCANFISHLVNGAQNYYGTSGLEIDSTLENNTSTVLNRGLAITKLPPTQTRGFQEDAAISIGSQDPSNFTTLTGVACAGTAGQFTGTLVNLIVGNSVKIVGTNTGTGTISGYVSGNQYYVSATDGLTTFTLQNLKDNSAIVTTAGSLTGLTFTPDWGTFGWKYGLSIASTNPGVWPYARDSILIGSPKGGSCGWGLDFHLITFFQLQVRGVGWTVDPVGNIAAQNVAGANLSSQPVAAPTIDAGNIGYTLAQTGLAMIIPSSGTMANNGAITITTALPATYANCYLYLPASAIVAGSAAGWYYATMSSATVGTVFNNPWTTGTPLVPASPTSFVTTGPGAYTQVLTTQNAASGTIPGNVLGVNGSIEADVQVSCSNSANVKTINVKYGGNIAISALPTTQTDQTITVAIRNRGVTGSQVGKGIKTGVTAATMQSTPPNYFNTDSTTGQTVVIGVTLANAADFIVIESYSLKVYPN